MSYGHLATAFPVTSPALPTPPQATNNSPSPPSSISRTPATANNNNNSSSNNNNNTGLPQQHHQHCCENGRPVITDPHTGQTVCSCQYSSALLSSYSRLPLTSNLFGTTGSYAASSQPYMPLGPDGSAFYSPLGANGSNIRDSGDAWRSLTQPSLYDTSSMGFYPYGPGYGGLDLNARRKNATRESTNTLKAWLQEHIKNPYPTKGEKIMLAIITKMTLTQVSTWFANARRRLKKENKMTWSPRNRSEDGDDEDDDENDGDDDRKTLKDQGHAKDEQIDVGTESSDCSKASAGDRRHNDVHGANKHHRTGSDVSHCRLSPELPHGSAYIASDHAQVDLDPGKPKIWSVTDFLGSAGQNVKDGMGGVDAFSKLDLMKSASMDYGGVAGLGVVGGGMAESARNAMMNHRSAAAAASSALSSLSNPSAHLQAYQSSLGGYGGGGYPYSLSSYGAGKLLRPSVPGGTGVGAAAAAATAMSRFSPFPSAARPLAMDSAYGAPRREIGPVRDGE